MSGTGIVSSAKFRSLAMLTFVGLVSGSCSSESPTQILVHVDGNFTPGAINNVHFEITSLQSGKIMRGSCGGSLPYSFSVLATSSSNQTVRVHAKAVDKDDQLLVEST